MFLYLKTAYEQWSCDQDLKDLLDREEVFLDMMHRAMGYDKQQAREFLLKQPWYHSKHKLNVDKLDDSTI